MSPFCIAWRLHFTSFASALRWQFILYISTNCMENLPAHIRSCTSLSQFLTRQASPFQHPFPSLSVIASVSSHTLFPFVFIFLLIFFLIFNFTFILYLIFCVFNARHPRAPVVRRLSKFMNMIWFNLISMRYSTLSTILERNKLDFMDWKIAKFWEFWKNA